MDEYFVKKHYEIKEFTEEMKIYENEVADKFGWNFYIENDNLDNVKKDLLSFRIIKKE